MGVSAASIEVLRRSRVGLLTTYRRSGEPVATPVSIAAHADGAYFVTPATSGKARRIAVRADVTLSPSTITGTATGPATEGRAYLVSGGGRLHVRRLLQPGGPLFWSYLLYRIRGHRMNVYEVRFAESRQRPSDDDTSTLRAARLYRAVRLTARASAMLFAAAKATSAIGPPLSHASRPFYVAFLTAHAVHFTVVARYAVVNGGRDLFPGGRSLRDVGGWRTMVGIYSLFAGLAVTGWVTDSPLVAKRSPWHAIGHGATWAMATMFVGVYLGQFPRSRWYAVPATAVAGAMVADGLARRLRYLSAEHSAK